METQDVMMGAQYEEWGVPSNLEDSSIAKSRVNRPGYEAAAIKGAQRQMNYPKSDKIGKNQEKGWYVCDADIRNTWKETATFRGPKRLHMVW